MASPVKDAKAKTQTQFPGASVHSRGKGWIKHQHPTNPARFFLDTQVGGRGWHFGQAPFDETNEVDTAWVASSGAWDWEVTKNDFHSFVRDSVPVSYRYVDAETSHFVELTFNDVEWVNDEGQSENAASFSQVTPTIDDGNIRWNGIAPGWDVEVQAQTGRLAKWIHIDSLANLGSPTIGGTNIRLRFSLTWQKSSGLEVWVDGAQWNEKNNTWVETVGDIEFRDEITQEPIFYFEQPHGEDSSDVEDTGAPMAQRVRRTGNNFYGEIETPWTWLQNATFPIRLDDTINPQVGASLDDSWENAGSNAPTTTTPLVDDTDEWLACRWTGVTIADGATVDVAYVDLVIKNANGDEPHVMIDFEDGSAPGAFTTGTSNISGRTGTTTTVEWDDSNYGISAADQWLSAIKTPPEIKTIIQELVDSYDYSSGSSMVCRMEGQTAGGGRDLQSRSYDNNTAHGPILHIEFTAGGGDTIPLDTATITANGQAVSQVSGAVTKSLDTAALIAGGQILSIVPGEAITAINTSNITANGQAVSQVSGEATTLLDTPDISASGQSISLTQGAVTTALAVANITAGGQALSLALGEATTVLAVASLVAAGQVITVDAGGVAPQTVIVDTAALTAGGQSLSLLLGAVSASLNTANITAGGQVLALVVGEATTILAVANITAAGQVLALAPGEATTLLDVANITASGQVLTLATGFIVSLDTASVTAGGQALGLAPGVATTAVDTAQITSAGQALSLAMGGTTVAVSTASATANAQAVALLMGVALIGLSTANIDSTGQTLGLLVGQVLAIEDCYHAHVLDGLRFGDGVVSFMHDHDDFFIFMI